MKLWITALASLTAAPAFAHQSGQSQHFHSEPVALLVGILFMAALAYKLIR